MAAVARAYKARSLADFQAALAAHAPQLGDDPIVQRHLSVLYDTLLEGCVRTCHIVPSHAPLAGVCRVQCKHLLLYTSLQTLLRWAVVSQGNEFMGRHWDVLEV